MNMLEKIQTIMDEKGLKVADVARGADLPYTTVDGLFKKGVENARFPTLKKLAQFFDVSMEYLINDEEDDRDYGKILPHEFTKEEHRLVFLWRKLSRDEQMKIMGRIEARIEEQVKE